MTTPALEITNLQKRFGNFVALDQVSLDFPAGELVARLMAETEDALARVARLR